LHYIQRSCLTFVCLFLFSCSGLELPDQQPQFRIEYSVPHYQFSPDPFQFHLWQQEVSELRHRLNREYPRPQKNARPDTGFKEDKFLNEAVDPAYLIRRDPRYFWRTPVILTWCEIIDAQGNVSVVHVITSNQDRRTDQKILAYCVNGKKWIPATIDGKPVASIRSASINLGESPYHISYWEKKTFNGRFGFAAMTVIILLGMGAQFWYYRRRKKLTAKAESQQGSPML